MPGVVPDMPAAGPPIELVLLELVELPMAPPVVPAVLPLVLSVLAVPLLDDPLPEVPLPVEPLDVLELSGAVVLGEVEDVVGVTTGSSRLPQAPSDTTATSASAAHEVNFVFMRNSLKVLKIGEGSTCRHRRPL